MLIVKLPAGYESERCWVLDVILNQFLGLNYSISKEKYNEVSIECDGKSIFLKEALFKIPYEKWLSKSSLPTSNLKTIDVSLSGLDVILVDQCLPVIFGQPLININEKSIDIDIDILGSVFFMLSRYEEVALDSADSYGRFPAKASLALQAGFMERPIVDEYVELLWSCLSKLWPNLKRKKREYRKYISCDVDAVYECSHSCFSGVSRKFAGDLLKRRSTRLAVNTLRSSLKLIAGDFSEDPNYQAVRWMMNANENVGNKVAFYFIADSSTSDMDGCYSLNEAVVKDLIVEIYNRGHEIGLHGSYDSYNDFFKLKKESDLLRGLLVKENISQNVFGGRQHYLRWKSSETARNLNDAGFDYDSTLTYAENPGFRCGTCHEFTMFDLLKRKALNVIQRPLVIMERSVLSDKYLGMGYDVNALEYMLKLKAICKKFKGNFTLLWHNSYLVEDRDRKFYLELIK